jgi:tetratricopeptide (TPR) repeat protein
MARKLSHIAHSAWIALPFITLAIYIGPNPCYGQSLSRGRTSKNPFAAESEQAKSAQPSGAPSGRRATTYRNPFKERDTAPTDASFRYGPTSRWHRSSPPQMAMPHIDAPSSLAIEPLPKAASPVRAAILGADTVLGPPPTLTYQPLNDPRQSSLSRDTQGDVDKKAASAAPTEPPDPAEYEESLAPQPIWLSAKSRRSFSPIDQTAFERPLNENSAADRHAPHVPAVEHDEPIFISDLSETPENLSDTPESWLSQAKQLAGDAANEQKLSQAVELCNQVIADNSSPEQVTSARRLGAEALNRRGELLLDGDRQQEALADFEAATALDGTCSAAIHNRAVLRAQQNEFDAALEDFNRVIELNPALAIAYRNRAELLAAQGKLSDAVADYTRAVEAMPDDAELYRARAHALQSLGEFERALADLNRSIQLDPQAAEGLAQRGNIMAERGDFDHALADFKQAAAIAPDLADAHRSLAWVYATCPDDTYRDSQQGLAAAQLAVKLSKPDDYFALEALAAAQANAGQFDNAVETQRQALDAAPAHSAAPIQHRLALYQRQQPYRSEVLHGSVRQLRDQ